MKTEGKRNLLRQPDEIRLMTGSAQTEQETAPDAAAFRAGDVTVEFAEADGSLAVFVQAQNTPVRELVLTWKAMFGGAGEVLGDTWERGYGDLEWKKEADHIGMPWYLPGIWCKGASICNVLVGKGRCGCKAASGRALRDVWREAWRTEAGSCKGRYGVLCAGRSRYAGRSI